MIESMKYVEALVVRFVQAAGRIIVNGMEAVGKLISVQVSRESITVITDGNLVYEIKGDRTANGVQLPAIAISIAGEVQYLRSMMGSVSVEGAVGTVSSAHGDVYCHGVSGDVSAQLGNVTCGDVKGSVYSTNGNITCVAVAGDAEAINGNVKVGGRKS